MRIHVLHRAASDPVFGVEMMDELKRHGYDISPGTLYPLLHALEDSGVLVSSQEVAEGKVRKYYRITPAGSALLAELQAKIRELVDEVLERAPPALGKQGIDPAAPRADGVRAKPRRLSLVTAARNAGDGVSKPGYR
jgi:DNA-binding PadR family transcriptional regulator